MRQTAYLMAARLRLPLFVLLSLVSLHACLFVLQPMLSSLKTLDILGLAVLAGSLVRAFSCGIADVINEVYGLAAARLNVLVSMMVRLLGWLVIGLVVVLPGTVKDEAFLGSLFISFRLVVAGLIGLVVIEWWLDATLFDWLKRKLPVGFWFRHNLTNALNHLLGSLLVLTIGFYGTGRPIVAVAVGGLVAKLVLGAALTPVFAGAAKLLKPLGSKTL